MCIRDSFSAVIGGDELESGRMTLKRMSDGETVETELGKTEEIVRRIKDSKLES